MSSQLPDQGTAQSTLTDIAIQPVATPAVSRFDELYAKLNDEQKLAVDTIEGPVMVVAGPGTGKTQILTLRIANILSQTQLNPRNILALTFTESAASNMRQRLVSIIGPAAYGVGIYTFHGFANLVITEFPYKFQFAKELQAIDEIEQIEIIEKLIDSLSLIELRPPRAPYHYLREIIGRLSELKKENIAPEQLKQLTIDERERLEQDPASYHEKGAHKGKMKAAITEELKHLGRCSELADIYAGYQKALLKKGLYDYEDMILFVLQAFENDPDLKAYYQERFQYILVDEYQDTNNSQNRMIELLADFFESPNLFVVGDDKQSIFRFQGASMANLLRFHQRFPDMKVISLKNNYRSRQTILDGSHSVINNAKERITKYLDGIDDQLTANTGTALDIPPIGLGIFSSTDIERYWVVNKAKSLIEQGNDPAEIAIIYKENREAEALADLLGRLNVPFALERGSNVLLDTDIRRLITMLRAVSDPTDSRSLFEMLHYDFMSLAGADLLKLMAYRAKERLSLVEVLTALPCSCEIHEAALPENTRPIVFSDCQQIDGTVARLAEWRTASCNKSMPELVELVLNESGLLSQITESPTRIERLHRLRRFFDEVKRLASRTPSLTLDKLLEHFDRLVENNIQLVPEPLDVESAGGAVRLMTAHKSKGLEFEHVFIPNLIDKHWGNASRRTLIKLPHSIVGQPTTDAADEKNEDDRRLFYVALTRAKQCLHLTYATARDGRQQLPSQFLAEINETYLTPVETETIETKAGAHLLALFTPIAEATFTDQEATYLRQLIKEQPLTPTGLNNYLRCPKGYLYKNLLRIPTAKTAQQGYGTAIHAAMQAFFMQHKATKHVPTLEDLLSAFEQALQKEIMSEAEYVSFHRIGKQILTDYYEKNLKSVTPTVAVEYSFDPHHVTIPSEQGDIWVTGRLDKLELMDPQANTVRVIDYKTGRARSRNEIEGKTAKADEDYLRQLRFYQMLADTDKQFPYKVAETGLAFVDDDDRFPIEIFTISKEEVQDLKELVKQTYARMLELEFPHIEDPTRPPCEFCDM